MATFAVLLTFAGAALWVSVRPEPKLKRLGRYENRISADRAAAEAWRWN